MDRRAFLGLAGVAGGALAAPAVFSGGAEAAPNVAPIERALVRFRQLPGRKSYVLRVGRPGGAWETSHNPRARLFVGSAFKTFVLTTFLRDVEAGRLSESTGLVLDDGIRSLSSPVFLDLAGTTPARSALEAMIAHSDNTATDMALRHVSPDRVREFIARAGFSTVRIPDSTRLMFSYLAGAPIGVDVGWEGMQRIADGGLFGRPRSPMNNRVTMRGTAAQYVEYYQRVLEGRYFDDTASLTEFRRISSMATALWAVVPPNVPAYGKGGSIEWENFNCFSLPGQMLLGSRPVTFCFTLNWNGPPETIPAVQAEYVGAIRDALERTAAAFG